MKFKPDEKTLDELEPFFDAIELLTDRLESSGKGRFYIQAIHCGGVELLEIVYPYDNRDPTEETSHYLPWDEVANYLTDEWAEHQELKRKKAEAEAAKKRIDEAKRRQLYEAKREREEYERLRAKFEDTPATRAGGAG